MNNNITQKVLVKKCGEYLTLIGIETSVPPKFLKWDQYLNHFLFAEKRDQYSEGTQLSFWYRCVTQRAKQRGL